MAIKIGGIEITIEYASIENMANNYGLYFSAESKIKIADYISESQKKSTLLHEIIEAMNHIYSIGLKHEQVEKLEVAIGSFDGLKLNVES